MIVDLSIGFNEIDLFRIRYHELNPIVNKFVIVEATHTHRGDIKLTHFADWYNYCTNNPPEILDHDADIDWGKIEIITWDNGADFAPLHKDYSWVRENFQREILGFWATKNLAPDDLCILSDMDEIPSADALQRYLAQPDHSGVWRFEQHLCYLFFNGLAGKWCGSKIFQTQEISTMSGSSKPMTDLVRYRPEEMIAGTVTNGGWHLSSCGGLDKVRRKMVSYAHTEQSDLRTIADIQDSLDRAVDPFHKQPLQIVDCNFLPKYVLDNLEYFIKNEYIRL